MRAAGKRSDATLDPSQPPLRTCERNCGTAKPLHFDRFSRLPEGKERRFPTSLQAIRNEGPDQIAYVGLLGSMLCLERSPGMGHVVLPNGSQLPVIDSGWFQHGIALFLPALPCRPFPLEGFDFCRTSTFAGPLARLFCLVHHGL